MTAQLLHGDALDVLATLPARSVAAVITDPPYGTTQAEWDRGVDLTRFWREARRVCQGPIVMTAAQPFTTDLITSNRREFAYAMVWVKTRKTGHLNASWRPLQQHEDVLVFRGERDTFNPQRGTATELRGSVPNRWSGGGELYGAQRNSSWQEDGTRHPTTVLEFASAERGEHPTAKPVDLMRYLVRTYTNPGDLIVDPFMGSGTTGVAALMEGRRFIGVELDADHFATADKRLRAAAAQPRLLEAV